MKRGGEEGRYGGTTGSGGCGPGISSWLVWCEMAGRVGELVLELGSEEYRAEECGLN